MFFLQPPNKAGLSRCVPPTGIPGSLERVSAAGTSPQRPFTKFYGALLSLCWSRTWRERQRRRSVSVSVSLADAAYVQTQQALFDIEEHGCGHGQFATLDGNNGSQLGQTLGEHPLPSEDYSFPASPMSFA